MSNAHIVLLELYKAVLPQLVKSNMPSHSREEAVRQALLIALDAAAAFAKLTEDETNAKV